MGLALEVPHLRERRAEAAKQVPNQQLFSEIAWSHCIAQGSGPRQQLSADYSRDLRPVK
jgi:hypothetical protein